MRVLPAFTVLACALLCAQPAFAHRIDEYLQATIFSLQPQRVHASMRLIPGILVAPSVVAGIDSDGDGAFSADEQRAYAERVLRDQSVAIDERALEPRLVSWHYPQPAQLRQGLGEIQVEYTLELPPGGPDRRLIVSNRHLAGISVYLANAAVPDKSTLRIEAQKRNEPQSTYELDYRQSGGADGTGNPATRGAADGALSSSLFLLGVRHIAAGTDHLLFLLTLLLPAPLLVARGRWGPPAGVRESTWRAARMMTAFTIGHSVTLSLAAFGILQAPRRPIEVLIALSIFFSACHALRPAAAGRETWIAAFFGLIHGLAFAATLERLGFGSWERVEGLLAFNLGIEAMQAAVVAAALPVLILLSRSRAYAALRVGGALVAGALSLGWAFERTFEPFRLLAGASPQGS